MNAENGNEEVTPKMLADIRKTVADIKTQIDQATGRLEIIQNQIKEQEKILLSLDVTPETAQSKIDELDKETTRLYQEAKEIEEVFKKLQGRGI